LGPAEFEDISMHTSCSTEGNPHLPRGNGQSEVVEHIASPELILPNPEARGTSHDNVYRDGEQFARRRLLWILEGFCSHINLLEIEVAFFVLQYFLRKRVLL